MSSSTWSLRTASRPESAPGVSPEVDPILRRWEDFIRPYWTPERVWVDAGYRTIPFPFPELPTPEFQVRAELSRGA